MAMTEDTALQALGETQRIVRDNRHAIDRLLELAKIADTPPLYDTIALTTLTPVRRFEASESFKSLGIYNPTAVEVFAGLSGASPRASARAISCPAGAVVVLPVVYEDLEIGADLTDAATAAALAAGDAVIHIFRYRSVQALALGTYA